MAKILVADDNSNIQKMVGLALKDQGIDVVAVGNGEAAVRKISDVRPDLVLADVFMPVRNGYEVCKYVKTDSALSHIPVILLVGAFDPLDEQEAQRVGADGVLKKPFVPPDPLISMVKSALTRAGVSYANEPQEKTQQPETLRARDLIAPRPPSVPVAEEVPMIESEPVAEEIPVRPAPLNIDVNAGAPVAFGSLLETPATETEEDPGYISPHSGPERDWRSSDEEEEEEPDEDKPKSSWRRDADETFGNDDTIGAVRDWRDTAFDDAAGRKSRIAEWESLKKTTTLVETASTITTTETAVTEVAATEVAAAVDEKPAEPQPVQPVASSSNGEAWSTATVSASEEKTVSKEVAVVEAPPIEKRDEETAKPDTGRAEAVAPESKPKSFANAWFAPPPSPWDAEAQRATQQLASTWDTVAPAVVPPAVVPPTAASSDIATTETAKESVPVVETGNGTLVTDDVNATATLPAATVEAIREEAAQVAAETAQEQSPDAPKEEARVESPVSATASEPEKASTPNMDDVVAKVLAKMSPDMLQAVTREILKPVVEAIVREELNKKS